ncbi:hypothetical protein [Brevifollis gellanilyticus]|uniref:Uncharacterized protein n=1 Tax=Brevifollis gellanilyticus TaxID=748831 RepID=A0A512MCQ7_9BACT|nr:hypothetical protein [Brevifollis gellanilyticus]GEP44515.1 hypothetical protein BGE01nite_38060 [Brevifollis gellanilyticus]
MNTPFSEEAACGHVRLQRLILRISALAALLALPAVILPRLAAEKVSWIMGFGQPPMTPLMLYMMAGGGAVYVGQAVLLWTMSTDVVRYQPLVRLVGRIYLVCAPVFLWIDTQAGLPKWWMGMDCLGCLFFGAALLWACRRRAET